MNGDPKPGRFEARGEPISAGVAMGTAYIFKQINLDALLQSRFPVEDVSSEFERLDRAIQKSVEQLDRALAGRGHGRAGAIRDILTAQRLVLADVLFMEQTKSLVRNEKINTEHVLARQIKALEKQFSAAGDAVLKTRAMDVQDVYHRLLRNLLEIEHLRTNPVGRLNAPVIFVAEKFLPSDFTLLETEKFRGVVLEKGSRFSHVAIIARSLGVPAVAGIAGISGRVRNGDTVFLDGADGRVVVNPAPREAADFKHALKTPAPGPRRTQPRANLVCRPQDGGRIKIEANVGSVEEAEQAFRNGANGVGLLRSEIFYMARPARPSVAEERDFYRKIIRIMKNRPVTIRLLDLGADKIPPYLGGLREENPQLGARGIRYLLKNPGLLENHLESILPLAREAPVKILLPFIGIVEDLERALSAVHRLCRAHRVERKRVSVGIMVEIPSAAFAIDDFLARADFVSIGTNDLVQYTFAASRDEGGFDEYRQALHPFLLRLLKRVADAAARRRKPVAVCGEIASDPLTAGLLAALGVDALSMPPQAIARVYEALNGMDRAAYKRLARSLLNLNKAEEVHRALEGFKRKNR